MIPFKEYTKLKDSREVVNHLDHIDDAPISSIFDIRQAIDYLQMLNSTLTGDTKDQISATIKYDGAPSIFAGIDPADGKFFVAKKSFLNKLPRVYKTAASIDADTTGELSRKLKSALKYLPELGITGVLQGDFLFTQKDLRVEVIDGVEYVTFHPNSIVYAVPTDSGQSKEILASKIGIVWHTRYDGEKLSSMTASSDPNATRNLIKSKNVWCTDVSIGDISTIGSIESSESQKMFDIVSKIVEMSNNINPSMYDDFDTIPDLRLNLKIYKNHIIKIGKKYSGDGAVSGFKEWYVERIEVEKSKRKSDVGRLSLDKKVLKMFDLLNRHRVSVDAMFKLQDLLIDAKDLILLQLNKIDGLKTFLRTKEGYRNTGQEGFVITDTIGRGALKLVDRNEFSRANFSDEYLKGWQRE